MSELKLNYTKDEVYADFEDTPISYVQKLLQDWLSLYSAYNAMMNIANDYATERDMDLVYRKGIEAELTDLRKRIKGAVAEIEKAEKKYEQQFYAGKRLNVHPIEYTEGLVSGYKSAWIYLHQHGLIEESEE